MKWEIIAFCCLAFAAAAKDQELDNQAAQPGVLAAGQPATGQQIPGQPTTVAQVTGARLI